MIDAGSGVARLLERPELLDGVQRLDILLTHFHLDHVCGLAYLPALRHFQNATIWGPGQSVYGASTEELLGRVSRQPLHPVPLEKQHIAVRDLPATECFELAGLRIGMRVQPRHSAPTLGFRFEDSLAWITDTAYDSDSVGFAAGCEVLAHEAWFLAQHPRNPEMHSAAAEAAEIASAAGVGRLLLIHLPPFERSVAPLLREARRIVPDVAAARDGEDVEGPGFAGPAGETVAVARSRRVKAA
jgi:ribonuclease BN (tRNA processing enzyme)